MSKVVFKEGKVIFINDNNIEIEVTKHGIEKKSGKDWYRLPDESVRKLVDIEKLKELGEIDCSTSKSVGSRNQSNKTQTSKSVEKSIVDNLKGEDLVLYNKLIEKARQNMIIDDINKNIKKIAELQEMIKNLESQNEELRKQIKNN